MPRSVPPGINILLEPLVITTCWCIQTTMGIYFGPLSYIYDVHNGHTLCLWSSDTKRTPITRCTLSTGVRFTDTRHSAPGHFINKGCLVVNYDASSENPMVVIQWSTFKISETFLSCLSGLSVLDYLIVSLFILARTPAVRKTHYGCISVHCIAATRPISHITYYVFACDPWR